MDQKRLQELMSGLEALLFIHGEPIPKKRIIKLLELSVGEVETLLEEFGRRLEDEARGLALVVDNDKAQLVTKHRFSKFLQGFVKEELSEDLTPASLETLSIISYLSPISRNRIEYIRGVNSIFTLRSLQLRGLIERFSDPENANSYLYRPSFDFLRYLGLSRKEDLPEYKKFQSLLARFETHEQQQS